MIPFFMSSCILSKLARTFGSSGVFFSCRIAWYTVDCFRVLSFSPDMRPMCVFGVHAWAGFKDPVFARTSAASFPGSFAWPLVHVSATSPFLSLIASTASFIHAWFFIPVHPSFSFFCRRVVRLCIAYSESDIIKVGDS